MAHLNEVMTLADRAVLVNLSISQWSAAKSDKKVNREVSQNHGSDVSMGNYRKCLVAREAIKKVTEISGAVRQEHYRLTLPWRDSGDRILSSQGYFDYAKILREKQTDWEIAVSAFCDSYPQYVEDARAKLNGLFDPSDYPSLAEIRGKFSFKFEVLPLPVADDFRVNLGAAEVTRLRSQIQADSDAALRRAMSDVWSRMRTVIAAMSDRLKVYAVRKDGSVEHPFRDSVVTNITDLLEIIPSLNLTGDSNVEQFAAAMRDELTRYSPEQLRNAEYARTDTAARADEILAKMSAFIA
jgi:hypothetical protein